MKLHELEAKLALFRSQGADDNNDVVIRVTEYDKDDDGHIIEEWDTDTPVSSLRLEYKGRREIVIT